LGTMAPLGSVTVPVMEPVYSWALVIEVSAKRAMGNNHASLPIRTRVLIKFSVGITDLHLLRKMCIFDSFNL